MAQIVLSGDGLTISLEDEIARNDELLKRALAPHYPDLANALISREEKDGVLVVTVARRAGPKGAEETLEEAPAGYNPHTRDVVKALAEAPFYCNPALWLAWQLGHLEAQGGLTLDQQLALQPEIERALAQGEAECEQVEKTLKALKSASAVPARHVPAGF